MALLNGFKKVEKDRNSVHKIVDSTYTSFTDLNGRKYFQIDTYGTNDRELKGKVSQSIQLDKQIAEELISILKKEFNI